MRYYADTSWWLSYKCRRDAQHTAAITLFDRDSEAEVLWTPWQRVEVFNGFCQAERAGMLEKGESRQIIRLLEQEVRLGYWPHVEFDWTDAVRTAGELRAEHSLNMVTRAMDLFHVAIAIEVGAEALLSFDQDQIHLARQSGIEVVKLRPKRALNQGRGSTYLSKMAGVGHMKTFARSRARVEAVRVRVDRKAVSR